MKILARQKLEALLTPYPGPNIKDRLQFFCQEKKSESPGDPPSFSSLIDRAGTPVVHIYGENPALLDLLQESIWHPHSGKIPK